MGRAEPPRVAPSRGRGSALARIGVAALSARRRRRFRSARRLVGGRGGGRCGPGRRVDRGPTGGEDAYFSGVVFSASSEFVGRWANASSPPALFSRLQRSLLRLKRSLLRGSSPRQRTLLRVSAGLFAASDPGRARRFSASSASGQRPQRRRSGFRGRRRRRLASPASASASPTPLAPSPRRAPRANRRAVRRFRRFLRVFSARRGRAFSAPRLRRARSSSRPREIGALLLMEDPPRFDSAERSSPIAARAAASAPGRAFRAALGTRLRGFPRRAFLLERPPRVFAVRAHGLRRRRLRGGVRLRSRIDAILASAIGDARDRGRGGVRPPPPRALPGEAPRRARTQSARRASASSRDVRVSARALGRALAAYERRRPPPTGPSARRPPAPRRDRRGSAARRSAVHLAISRSSARRIGRASISAASRASSARRRVRKRLRGRSGAFGAGRISSGAVGQRRRASEHSRGSTRSRRLHRAKGRRRCRCRGARGRRRFRVGVDRTSNAEPLLDADGANRRTDARRGGRGPPRPRIRGGHRLGNILGDFLLRDEPPLRRGPMVMGASGAGLSGSGAPRHPLRGHAAAGTGGALLCVGPEAPDPPARSSSKASSPSPDLRRGAHILRQDKRPFRARFDYLRHLTLEAENPRRRRLRPRRRG